MYMCIQCNVHVHVIRTIHTCIQCTCTCTCNYSVTVQIGTNV